MKAKPYNSSSRDGVLFSSEEEKLINSDNIFRVFHWQFFINYVFSVSLNFGTCCITSQWGKVQSKECYFMYTDTFLAFLLLLFIETCVSIIFISFFDEVSIFRNRILTNQKPDSNRKWCLEIVSETICSRQIYWKTHLVDNFWI